MKFNIQRTGDLPLTFTGEKLAEADTQEFGGKAQTERYFSGEVYETTGGRHVIAVTYHTTWKGEAPHQDAVIVYPEPESIREALEDLDPVQHVAGFPPGEKYAARQANLITHMNRMWAHLISELLTQAGVSETIE